MSSGTWIALGVAIGVAIGAIWESIGIAVGIALGAGMGGAMYAYASDAESKRRKEGGDPEDEAD